MTRSIENRIEAIERQLTQMGTVERCDECGGPVPYTTGILRAIIHADGEYEYLYDRCDECHQPVGEDGRGKGEPSRSGYSITQLVAGSEYFGPKTDSDDPKERP